MKNSKARRTLYGNETNNQHAQARRKLAYDQKQRENVENYLSTKNQCQKRATYKGKSIQNTHLWKTPKNNKGAYRAEKSANRQYSEQRTNATAKSANRQCSKQRTITTSENARTRRKLRRSENNTRGAVQTKIKEFCSNQTQQDKKARLEKSRKSEEKNVTKNILENNEETKKHSNSGNELNKEGECQLDIPLCKQLKVTIDEGLKLKASINLCKAKGRKEVEMCEISIKNGTEDGLTWVSINSKEMMKIVFLLSLFFHFYILISS